MSQNATFKPSCVFLWHSVWALRVWDEKVQKSGVYIWHVHESTPIWTFFRKLHVVLCLFYYQLPVQAFQACIETWVCSNTIVNLLNHACCCWELWHTTGVWWCEIQATTNYLKMCRSTCMVWHSESDALELYWWNVETSEPLAHNRMCHSRSYIWDMHYRNFIERFIGFLHQEDTLLKVFIFIWTLGDNCLDEIFLRCGAWLLANLCYFKLWSDLWSDREFYPARPPTGQTSFTHNLSALDTALIFTACICAFWLL
jgi:hypothetical protein